jgi:hypothetical protein
MIHSVDERVMMTMRMRVVMVILVAKVFDDAIK